MKNKSFQLYNNPGPNNNLHEQLLNALPQMIMVVDKKDDVLYMNKNLRKSTGKMRDEEFISVKEIINVADWDNWNENIFNISKLNDEQDCAFKIRFSTAVGIRYIHLLGKALKRDKNLKPLTYFFTGEDVTEQYKKENKQSENRLSYKSWKNFVSKSSIEQKLELVVKDLDRSNKDLEEFAYTASHDLQEPLRKITAFSSSLIHKYEKKLGEEGKLYLNKIDTAAAAMKQLIENLLQVSKTAANFQPFAEVDLNDILDEVKQDHDFEIEGSNAEITFENLPVIEASPSQMKQLFSNLLSNAIKFSLKHARPQIQIHSQKISHNEKHKLNISVAKTYYKITFRDKGIGFNQDAAEDIFKIFYRLNGKSEYPGTGIGLAICSKIVQKHKGCIYAESKPGKGAAFIIILPKTQ